MVFSLGHLVIFSGKNCAIPNNFREIPKASAGLGLERQFSFK